MWLEFSGKMTRTARRKWKVITFSWRHRRCAPCGRSSSYAGHALAAPLQTNQQELKAGSLASTRFSVLQMAESVEQTATARALATSPHTSTTSTRRQCEGNPSPDPNSLALCQRLTQPVASARPSYQRCHHVKHHARIHPTHPTNLSHRILGINLTATARDCPNHVIIFPSKLRNRDTDPSMAPRPLSARRIDTHTTPH